MVIDKKSIGFTGGLFNRASVERTDAAWVKERLGRSESRFALIVEEEIAVASTAGASGSAAFWAGARDLAHGGLATHDAALLGVDEADIAHFAVWASSEAVSAMAAQLGLSADNAPLRALAMAGEIPPRELALIAHAKALLNWHGGNGYCARCGARTEMGNAGAKRICPACGREYFPRVDPVAIMLVHTAERCVLARQSRFPPGVYSALAGFIEPGETFEEAVRREVFEEAGLKVGEVKYLASQPWPFPSSLMIGCHARALSTSLVPDFDELEDIRWFERAEIVSMFEAGHPEGIKTPPPFAIAHHLIKSFAMGS